MRGWIARPGDARRPTARRVHLPHALGGGLHRVGMKTVEMEPMLVGEGWGSGSGSDVQDVLDPATGEVIARVPRANKDDAALAVEASHHALGAWSRADPAERGRVLGRLAALTREHAKELALLESRNNGKTVREAGGDVGFAAWTLEYFAGWADKVHGDTIPVPGDRLGYTLRQSLGVTAHISPWNYPLQLAVRSIAPALAAGCTVVAKPAEQTPLSLLRWAKLAQEAGVPPGVLQVLTGDGPVVGDALARHNGVAGISFTGGIDAGQSVMRAAADHVAPLALELGGKGANIVFPDADLKRAAKGVCFGIFMNAGQMCWAGSRLLVHEDIHDQVVDAVAAEAAKWKIGPGQQEGVRVGSLISQEQRARVQGFIDRAVDAGARAVTGGGAPDDPALAAGAFLTPTVLANVEPSHEVARSEVFGPVLAVLPFSDEEEALGIANDVEYGLMNGVWTNHLGRAHRLARDLESGMVSINEFPVTFPQTPFSGWKRSGFGVEQGRHAMEFYTRVKNVNVSLG